jgi:hypothetical protein
MRRKNKKAAIELSMSTIVILVLAMAMLVLGLILIKNIFTGGTTAIDKVTAGVEKEINDLFADKNAKIVIYPSTKTISMEQGGSNKGFAFSVRNNDLDPVKFKYNVAVDPEFDIQTKCKIRASEANSWLLISSGSINLGANEKMEDSELIKFTLPESAPVCTIRYRLIVQKEDGTPYGDRSIDLDITRA